MRASCPRHSFAALECTITDLATVNDIGEEYGRIPQYLRLDECTDAHDARPTALVVVVVDSTTTARSRLRDGEEEGDDDDEDEDEDDEDEEEQARAWRQGTFFLWRGAAYTLQSWFDNAPAPFALHMSFCVCLMCVSYGVPNP